MSVLLKVQGEPPDWDKFKAAKEWNYGQKPAGLISGKTYRAEGDPSKILLLEEWESSEAWWEYVESVGEEWNIHAGITADNKVDWDDTIWVLSDAPQAGRAAP